MAAKAAIYATINWNAVAIVSDGLGVEGAEAGGDGRLRGHDVRPR